METGTNAGFQTGARAVTSIWPGDVVQFDEGGIFIHRPEDAPLEPINGSDKYILPRGISMTWDEMEDYARSTAQLISAITGMTVTPAPNGSGFNFYQLGERT